MTKEQIISATKDYATRLGHCPTHTELKQELDLKTPEVRRVFGSYLKLLRLCGLKPPDAVRTLPMKELFVDWAEVTRKLGKIPSLSEYGRHSQFSRLPLIMRFGAWRRVPAGLLMFAEKSPVAQGWNDVLEMAKAHVEGQNSSRNKQGRNSAGTPLPGVIEGRPQYGEPMFQLPMLSVPTSESAVLILFGALAWELGFSILQSQAQFPDCHALRRMSADRWQLTSIEFELVSRNFQIHRHDPTKCDLIVCWEHNWPGCPLEVLELKTILLEKGIALWQKRERLPRAERETPATNANKSEEDVAGGENSPTTDELG